MGPAMPANVYQESDRITVAMPMPGLEPDDVTVVVEGTSLHLRGERRGDDQGARALGRRYLVEEWTVGPYDRTIALTAPVDGARANASLGNGVLMVILPKTDRPVSGRLYLVKVGQARGMRIGHVGQDHRAPQPGRLRPMGAKRAG